MINLDGRAAEIYRLSVHAAREAGYVDPTHGAAVIMATALARVEEEMPRGRHPRGHATGGALE